jgi:GNAT superfamily N-acetyltransferase
MSFSGTPFALELAMDSSSPPLPSGYSPIARGHLASVVTCLEMNERAALRPARPFPEGVQLQRWEQPDVDAYQVLFRAVGEDWLWFSRLVMPKEQLRSIICDPGVEVYVLRREGADIGILELDFRDQGQCELAFFGLTRDAVGQGLGRTLMNEAIERAWTKPIHRFWVHTCTLDSATALDFYRHSGFVPYALKVEVQADPRLTGAMPRTCAPHVPLIE